MTRAKAKARERALERAGFRHVSGWLPEIEARLVQRLIDDKREAVEAARQKEDESDE